MLIGEDEKLLIDNSPTDINAFAFLYNLQQPTKKIDSPDYFEFLKVLQIQEEQLINSYAKTSIRKNSPETATKRKIFKESQKQRRSKFQKPQKQDDQKQQQSSRALLTEDESSNDQKAEEGFETPYEPSVEKEKQWESYDEWRKIAAVDLHKRTSCFWKRSTFTKKHKFAASQSETVSSKQKCSQNIKGFEKKFARAYYIRVFWLNLLKLL